MNWRTLLPAVFALALVCRLEAEPAYTITDLGTAGGETSSPLDINNYGQIVGSSTDENGHGRPFLYSAGELQIIPSPYGPMPVNQQYYRATAINDLGEIAGSTFPSDGYGHFFCAVYVGGAWISGGGAAAGMLTTINNNHQIAGNTFPGAYGMPAPSELLGTVASGAGYIFGSNNYKGWGYVYGMNDAGAIVGQRYSSSDIPPHAFRYANSEYLDLGTLGGIFSTAYAINTNGIIVGVSDLPSSPGGPLPKRAFVFKDGAMSDLGNLGGLESIARDINASGTIIGNASTADDGPFAVRFDESGPVDLNTLIPTGTGWVLHTAVAINDYGQIVGTGTNPDGKSHGYLLTPVGVTVPAPPFTVIPTPTPTPDPTPEETPTPEQTDDATIAEQQPFAAQVKGGRQMTTTRSRAVIKVRTPARSLIVQYRVNATGRFKTASAAHDRNWTINARLQPGRNIVYIRTIDPDTGASTTIKVVVIRE